MELGQFRSDVKTIGEFMIPVSLIVGGLAVGTAFATQHNGYNGQSRHHAHQPHQQPQPLTIEPNPVTSASVAPVTPTHY